MNKKLKFLTQIGPRRNFVLPKSTGYHRLKPLNNCPDNVQFMAQKPDLFNFSKLFTLNLFFEFDSIDSCFNKQHLFKSTLSRMTVEQNYPRGQKFSRKMFNKLNQGTAKQTCLRRSKKTARSIQKRVEDSSGPKNHYLQKPVNIL